MNKIQVVAEKYIGDIFKKRFISDSSTNIAFIQDIENTLPAKQLNILDLGCLRGSLVRDFIQRGHLVVGLEDQKQEGTVWNDFYMKNLFTCDITRDFSVLLDEKMMICDYVMGFHLAGHMPFDRLALFFENVRKHLKVNGFFVGSIDLSDTFPQNQTIQLWQNRILRSITGFSFVEYPFQHIPYPSFTSFYYMLLKEY